MWRVPSIFSLLLLVRTGLTLCGAVILWIGFELLSGDPTGIFGPGWRSVGTLLLVFAMAGSGSIMLFLGTLGVRLKRKVAASGRD